MKTLILTVAAGALLGAASFGTAQKSDAQVRQAIIRASIASYPGSCPCPYSVARNGSRCGGRSAWSRPGGYSPKCYASDVSQADVAAWRRNH